MIIDYGRPIAEKHDEDLNCTLILVSISFAFPRPLGEHHVDLRGTGWFILRGHICFYHRPRKQHRTGLPRNTLVSGVTWKHPQLVSTAFPRWNGTNSTIAHIQSILYPTLSASLFAAFIAKSVKRRLDVTLKDPLCFGGSWICRRSRSPTE